MVPLSAFWELIEARANETPDAFCAVDELGRTLTFGDYHEACLAVATELHTLGIGVGTAVSWQLPTWLESAVLAGALSRLGAVQNPILPICREREVGFMVRQTGAQYLLVPGPDPWRGFDFVTLAQNLGAHPGDPSPTVIPLERRADSVWTQSAAGATDSVQTGALPAYVAPGARDVRWVFYTSGTTADPKGAKHSDHTVAAAARGVNQAFEMTPDDRFAMVFPVTHIGGVQSLMGTMIAGNGAIWTEAFEPHATVALLREQGVTIGAAGTSFWLAYLAVQRETPAVPIFPKLRLCGGGGSPKPPTLDAEIRNEVGGIGVASGYGLTECPSHCLNTVRDPHEKRAISEGRPSPGVEMRITDPDGRVLPANTEGEIRVRAPQLCLGYVDESLDGGGLDGGGLDGGGLDGGGLDGGGFDHEGFFRTGDLARLDDDGYLIISGRLKDIIIRKGENISAKEVEDILYMHPAVADAAVIGLPDADRGERACAVITTAPGAEPLTMETMAAWCREHGLMMQKVPEQLELVDDLPRNSMGKVLKTELRGRYSR